MILIVSVKGDLHAATIRRELAEKRGFTDCHIFECDQIAIDHRLSWQSSRDRERGLLLLPCGKEIDVEALTVIWWRRVRADQELPDRADEHEISLINNDCRGALGGLLQACFHGTWLSKPAATDKAANKIYQLSVASACGFRIPETLVSQSLEEVQEFTRQLPGRVIVKPVVGAVGPLMFTQFIGDPTLLDSQSYQVAPAIYQEYIEGTDHIRLNCFGDRSFAALIETSDLDWRPNLNVPIREWAVPPSLHQQVRQVLNRLDLAMGVVDLKRTPEGEFVWLEVNPQGQFLFLEPLTKMPLASHFAEYLLELSRPGNGVV